MPVIKPTPIQLQRPGSSRTLIRCLAYLRPYRPYVVGAYVLLLLSNGVNLAMPQIIRVIVDQGIRTHDMGAIRRGVLALLGITLLRAACTFLFGRWSEVASQSVAYDLRNAIHQKLHTRCHSAITTGLRQDSFWRGPSGTSIASVFSPGGLSCAWSRCLP